MDMNEGDEAEFSSGRENGIVEKLLANLHLRYTVELRERETH